MFPDPFCGRHTLQYEDRVARGQGDSTMRKRFRRRLSQRCCLLRVFVTVAPWIQGAAAQSAEEMMGVKQDHCSIAQGTLDGRTFVCMVWDHDPARFSDPTH